ncbi:MAG TPA: methyltransferase domain-containing protein, partial [Terriglobia bacterium]|nr:methyltransferase domain-containing protein [Terriglobia bacterium]
MDQTREINGPEQRPDDGIQSEQQYLQRLYKARFTPEERSGKDKIWKLLCDEYFVRWIKPTDTVMDLAAGYCEFINNIRCARKIALDINPDTAPFKNPDVELIVNDCTSMVDVESNSIDVIFTSSFFEHLPSKEALLRTLGQCYRVLRPGGRLLVLMPNIRFSYDVYWDFFDHLLPVSDRALDEAMRAIGYKMDVIYPQFVPYSTKSRLPRALFLIRWYLKIPFLW